MRKLRLTILSASVCAAAGIAVSAEAAEGLEYSYLQLDFVGRDIDAFQNDTSDLTERYDDGSGTGLEGSFAFNENFFVFGRYSDTDSDVRVSTGDVFLPANTDITQLDIGVGYNTEIAPRMDLVGRIAYTDIDFGEYEIGVTSNLDTIDEDSSDGFTADLGIRSQFLDNVEGSIGLRYMTIDSDSSFRDVDNTSIIGSIMYEMSRTWDLNFSLDVGDDVTTYAFGIRFSPDRGIE